MTKNDLYFRIAFAVAFTAVGITGLAMHHQRARERVEWRQQFVDKTKTEAETNASWQRVLDKVQLEVDGSEQKALVKAKIGSLERQIAVAEERAEHYKNKWEQPNVGTTD